MKTGLMLIAVVVLLAVAFFTLVGGYGHMWGGGMGMGYGYGGFFMWILLLVVIGLIAFLILQSVQSGSRTDQESPLDILKKRFAKGEITKEEYEEMRRKLLE
jgi:putative membrane protein